MNRLADRGAAAGESITAERFRAVIGCFTTGVTIVTTAEGGTDYATTASAVSSLSDAPPMLLVCMNRTSDTGRAISATGRFVVNVLRVEQAELAVRLARKGADKLEGVALRRGPGGLPLVDGAIATLECTVADEAVAATHVVHMATVDKVLAQEGEPLIYFKGRFACLGPSVQ